MTDTFIAEPRIGDGADEHEALLQFLYMAPIGLVQVDPDGLVEMMNPMAASLLMPFAAARGLANLFDTIADLAPGLRARVAAADPAPGPLGEPVRLTMAAPSTRPADEPRTLSLRLFRLDARRLMALLGDVSDDVRREGRALNAAARVDSLTDMPNRTAVLDYLREGMASATPAGRHCAVLFINCDRFKQVNDGLGWAAGDELLTLLANRLRSVLRRGVRTASGLAREPLAARLGGDEFVVVLDDLAHGDDIHLIAKRLLDIVGQPFEVASHQVLCTASMGVVARPQFAGGPDDILRDASIAMALAKRAGGARYVLFQPEMRARAMALRDMEEDLRVAIAEGQLFLVYQPVIGFARAGVCEAVDRSAGVEALVRWRHPTRGIVPPLDFIGLAEECGLIGAVGRQVLEVACRQFVAWRDALGTRAPRLLAVNLSRGQLDQPDIAASVAEILRTTGMRAADLQLEITESLAAQDELVQARLHELKALGLTLALDDFGTGYSSLSSLHLLPVDIVKIDRSFVSEAVTNPHHRVLVEATVRVAASLSMGTVAEGIETAEQSALICALGCGKGQGYYFSRPLPADELATWLAAG